MNKKTGSALALVAVTLIVWFLIRSGGYDVSGPDGPQKGGRIVSSSEAAQVPRQKAQSFGGDRTTQRQTADYHQSERDQSASGAVDGFLREWGDVEDIPATASYALLDAILASGDPDAALELAKGIRSASSPLAKTFLASALASLNTAEAAGIYLEEINSEPDPSAVAEMLDALPAFSESGAINTLTEAFDSTEQPEILSRIVETVAMKGDEVTFAVLEYSFLTTDASVTALDCAAQVLEIRSHMENAATAESLILDLEMDAWFLGADL